MKYKVIRKLKMIQNFCLNNHILNELESNFMKN